MAELGIADHQRHDVRRAVLADVFGDVKAVARELATEELCVLAQAGDAARLLDQDLERLCGGRDHRRRRCGAVDEAAR